MADKPESKLAAVLSALERKGICLPEDFTFEKPHSLDVLLGALESNLATLTAKGKTPPKPARPAKVKDGETSEVTSMAFDEADGNRSLVIKHLSPEAAEKLATIGLQRTGYGRRVNCDVVKMR